MTEFPALIVIVSLAQGGRSTPISSGYRPSFYFEQDQADAAIEYPPENYRPPGHSMRVKIRMNHPEYISNGIAIGSLFEFREGAKLIGYGVVVGKPVDIVAAQNSLGERREQEVRPS